jgi:hypothetical protein
MFTQADNNVITKSEPGVDSVFSLTLRADS